MNTNASPSSTPVPSLTVESAAPPSPSSVTVERIEVDWSWLELDRGPLHRWTAAPVYDGRYLVELGRSTPDLIVLVDNESGLDVVEHRVRDVNAGWVAHDVFLSSPWLIVTEANTSDPFGSGVRAYRYDLRSGTRDRLADINGFPEPGLQWSVAEGIAVFDTKHRERLVSCLVVMDIETLAWRERWCGPTGTLVDWSRLGPDDTVTFRLQEEPVPETEPCVRLFRMNAFGDEDPMELPLERSCTAFSGAGGPAWTAWSEVGLRSENIGRSRGFAQLPDESILTLDAIQTGTISACRGWVYWQVEVPSTSSEQLVRWQPGHDIEIVFETPSNSLLGNQQCAGGWMTVVVAEQAATETTIAILVPD